MAGNHQHRRHEERDLHGRTHGNDRSVHRFRRHRSSGTRRRAPVRPHDELLP